jgi:hypothetical protein
VAQEQGKPTAADTTNPAAMLAIGFWPDGRYNRSIQEPIMSETAAQLIHAFSTLPAHERHAVLIELARIAEADDDPLTNDEMSYAGEQVFAMYDAEEAEHGNAQPG